MTCCHKYGDCAQSDTCPIRTGTVLPHQRRHAERLQDKLSDAPCTLDKRGDDVPKPTQPIDQIRIIDLVSFSILVAMMAMAFGMLAGAVHAVGLWTNIDPPNWSKLFAALLAPFMGLM